MREKQVFHVMCVLAAFGIAVLSLPVCAAEAKPVVANVIPCGASGFRGHLQGLATDGKAIFWSFYDTLLKTDFAGRPLMSVPVVAHAGDLCVADGKLYVTIVIYGKDERTRREGRRSWIFVYDTDLNLIREVNFPTCSELDGITFHRGGFYVGSGSRGFGKTPHRTNPVLRLDRELNIVKEQDVDIGIETRHGVQTINVFGGQLVFGFYGVETKQRARILDPDTLKPTGLFPLPFGTATGAIPVPEEIAGAPDVIAVSRTEKTGSKETGGVKHFAKLLLYRLEKETARPYPADKMRVR